MDRKPLAQVVDSDDTRTDEQKVADNVKAQDPHVPVSVGERSHMDDLNYLKTAKYFDLSYDEMRDTSTAKQLSFLYDWASRTGDSNDIVDVLDEITNLKQFLGTRLGGQELINQMYQWTRLDTDRRRILKQMKAIHVK